MNAVVRLVVPTLVLLSLAACASRETIPLEDVLASDLSGDELIDAYFDRLTYLSSDADLFVAELEEAGFIASLPGREEFLLQNSSYHCNVWEYYDQETPMWALIQACHVKHTGEIELRRFGIARKNMTEDELGEGVD
ncbi:hypothetical protein [Alteraurantiacibacter aquimixticola]|uniref:DUF3192 domain-containing protein n=1 Tax=Alteraurantiacibacter aquimixticola TaxID=2489173 RepID=A0A4V4U8N9_9SPHN|nr:hypothetical protein [Alteraurantiacibacter aquimixticola]TIX50653.1 hypothetical protein E5222_10375 [Alteraurantiacibacter aquimixticola]